MPTGLVRAPASKSLNDPAMTRRVNALRKTDNLTNWFYLAREYLFAACVIGGAILLFETCFTSAWSLLWAARSVDGA